MQRFVVTSFIVLFNFVMQITLLKYASIGGILPNTSLAIIVSFAFLQGDLEGAIIGFFSGLLHDFMFGQAIGLHAFLGLGVGFLCGRPFRSFYSETLVFPLLLTIISSLAYGYLFYFFSILFTGSVSAMHYIDTVIIPETAYTAAVSIVIFPLISLINKVLVAGEKKKRKLFK